MVDLCVALASACSRVETGQRLEPLQITTWDRKHICIWQNLQWRIEMMSLFISSSWGFFFLDPTFAHLFYPAFWWGIEENQYGNVMTVASPAHNNQEQEHSVQQAAACKGLKSSLGYKKGIYMYRSMKQIKYLRRFFFSWCMYTWF